MQSKRLTGLGLISVNNLHQVNADTILKIISSLNLLQILILGVRGSILIDWISFEGWKGKLPFYIINCPQHGYQLSYPNGFKKTLVCPKCINEFAD